MSRKKILGQFAITFAFTFLVACGVSYLWGFIRHGAGLVDWKTALRMAFILGVTLPVSGFLGRRDGQK